MDTKLILHGGFAKGSIQESDEFFREMLKDTPNEVKILLVYFAKSYSPETTPSNIIQDKIQLEKNKGEKKLDIKIASEENFEDDVKWADVIYLHGGRSINLMDTLKKFPNIIEMLAGKIVAGDSAGATVMGKYFYSRNSKEIGNGLAILPYKIIVHHEDGAENPLADVEPELETIFLREYETRVFKI